MKSTQKMIFNKPGFVPRTYIWHEGPSSDSDTDRQASPDPLPVWITSHQAYPFLQRLERLDASEFE